MARTHRASGRAWPRDPLTEVRIPRGSVWMDARGTQSVEHSERGIARYIGEQANKVVELDAGAVGAIEYDPDLPLPASLESLSGSGVLRPRAVKRPSGVPEPSIFHVMSPFELFGSLETIWPSWARSGQIRMVATLYDLIPLIFPESYLDPDPTMSAVYRARLGLLRGAHQLLTISQATADDAMEHLGIPEERITVIDCGVSNRLSELAPDRRTAASILGAEVDGLRDGFLLYVGGHDWRKNLEGAIDAFGRLRESTRRAHQLVIVCKMAESRREELRAHARSLGVADEDLLFTGFVTDSVLSALYRSCGLFIFPSLYEGAGLPVLEAMSCGAPVAASNNASIPEILGDLEATFDPADPSGIATCIERVLADDAELDRLRERSRRRVELYTWKRVAERTLEGYERALDIPIVSDGSRRSRKRLAVITPWPPVPSGVANHSRHLVEELRFHAEVDVVTTGGNGAPDSSLPGVRIWDEGQFEWVQGLRDYDRLLYVLGSSPFHTHVYDALMERPGAVLIHDVRLLGLYFFLGAERRFTDGDWLQKKLSRLYGDRVPDSELRRAWQEDVYTRHGIYMTQEVQARADTILLHSRYQDDVLRAEAPAADTPHAIVPHGIPPAGATNGRADGAGPLIVTYGVVSMASKRMDMLLTAFRELAAELPSAHLAIVGAIDDADRETIEAAAARSGLASRVTVRGSVGTDEYWATLGKADLAVQLRTGSNGGEASGAVCDCIAARVPTIVSDIGWFAEVPEPVVLRVPADGDAATLRRRMAEAITSDALRDRIGSAQDAYAAENSYSRVAERYAEVLEL